MLALPGKLFPFWLILALILAACAAVEFGLDTNTQASPVSPSETMTASTIPAATASHPAASLPAGSTPTYTAPTPSGAPQPTPGEGPDSYLDDRSSADLLIRSYFNAINRRETLRAYSYWDDPTAALGSFEQFLAVYDDVISIDLTLGQVTGDAGAGQFYYAVPALLEARTTGDQVQTQAACYVLHLANPGAQAEPPFRPLAIRRARTELVEGETGAVRALEEICSGPGFSSENPIEPLETAGADIYLDNRSGPREVLESYFNAINRKEYGRAFSYWEETGAGSQAGTFEQFESGYAGTESVELITGEATGDSGAGHFYYSVPVVLKAVTTGGEVQTFSGCYFLHLVNPAVQAELPFRSLAIRSADIERVSTEAVAPEELNDLLNRECPDPGPF